MKSCKVRKLHFFQIFTKLPVKNPSKSNELVIDWTLDDALLDEFIAEDDDIMGEFLVLNSGCSLREFSDFEFLLFQISTLTLTTRSRTLMEMPRTRNRRQPHRLLKRANQSPNRSTNRSISRPRLADSRKVRSLRNDTRAEGTLTTLSVSPTLLLQVTSSLVTAFTEIMT